MLKVLSNILCDLDPKVKVIGQKAGICDGVPSTSALVLAMVLEWLFYGSKLYQTRMNSFYVKFLVSLFRYEFSFCVICWNLHISNKVLKMNSLLFLKPQLSFVSSNLMGKNARIRHRNGE